MFLEFLGKFKFQGTKRKLGLVTMIDFLEGTDTSQLEKSEFFNEER